MGSTHGPPLEPGLCRVGGTSAEPPASPGERVLLPPLGAWDQGEGRGDHRRCTCGGEGSGATPWLPPTSFQWGVAGISACCGEGSGGYTLASAHLLPVGGGWDLCLSVPQLPFQKCPLIPSPGSWCDLGRSLRKSGSSEAGRGTRPEKALMLNPSHPQPGPCPPARPCLRARARTAQAVSALCATRSSESCRAPAGR